MIQRLTALAAVLVMLAFPLAASAQSMSSTAVPQCPAGDPVVWVNTGTKVYHVKGDRYFGKTKAGTYACTSKAVAMGAHLSKAKAGKKAAAQGGDDIDAPDAMASAAPMTGKKKHRKAAAPMASPTL